MFLNRDAHRATSLQKRGDNHAHRTRCLDRAARPDPPLLGPAKAFGWADVSQLRAPISPEAGLLWLIAAALLIAGAIGLVLGAPWWWYPALPGVLLSQGLIVTAWSDAKFGTLANVIIALLLFVTALDARSSSYLERTIHKFTLARKDYVFS